MILLGLLRAMVGDSEWYGRVAQAARDRKTQMIICAILGHLALASGHPMRNMRRTPE